MSLKLKLAGAMTTMNNINTFNPTRLKIARKRRGLTLKALSTAVGITSKTLSDYENGRRDPTDRIMPEIANQLNFPLSFFELDDMANLDQTAVSFRSLARMTASVRDSAISAGQIALELNAWLEKKFKLPETDLLDLRNCEPETAAHTIRNEWALGERPIKNMIHMLEAKGVRIFSISEETADMDAFSFWMGKQPFIFLNTMKSVEHGRFDVAHELGHLVLHKHGTPLGKEAESQANKFASALLMPEGSIIANAPKYPTLNSVIKLKEIWLVSASALVRRLKDLRLLTEWYYRSLIVELSKRGYMKNEPNPMPRRETSKLLSVIFQTLRREGITKDKIAKELSLFTQDIDSLIFNLAIIGIEGGSQTTIVPTNKIRKNHLRVIK